jgi:hypothetical protein
MCCRAPQDFQLQQRRIQCCTSTRSGVSEGPNIDGREYHASKRPHAPTTERRSGLIVVVSCLRKSGASASPHRWQLMRHAWVFCDEAEMWRVVMRYRQSDITSCELNGAVRHESLRQRVVERGGHIVSYSSCTPARHSRLKFRSKGGHGARYCSLNMSSATRVSR